MTSLQHSYALAASARLPTNNPDFEARIRHRENQLIASAAANEELLRNRNLLEAISFGLHELGGSVQADRCYLFENAWNDSMQAMVCNQRLEWTSASAEPQIDNPDLQNVPLTAVDLFMQELSLRQPFQCIVRLLPAGPLQDLLAVQEIHSLLILPIHVEDVLWGFVGFDDCQHERLWAEAEISILVSFASSIANAVIRKRIEDALEQSRNEAIQANKAKSEFLANVTHEIRTPLHSVIGYADMLSAFAFPPEQMQHYGNLRNSVHALSQLITDILDVSRIEGGVFELNPANCHLKHVIGSALTTVGHLVDRHYNTFELRLADDLPDLVRIDPLRLRQVLVNLLSNALKFTSNGSVSLQVQRRDDALEFIVEDSGIGMDEQQLQHLFEPFVQFDSSIAKKYQGCGLGLPIARHIVSLFGSALRVASQPGKGSRFSFLLPLDSLAPSAHPGSSAAGEPPEPAPSGVASEIMIIEDNQLSMRLAVTMLQLIAPGSHIRQADSGSAALELVDKGALPQLVLMDLQMPEMDGFETTRKLRQGPLATSKIVALSATATPDIRQQCLNAGMDDFMSKPFTRSQLRQLLVRHADTAQAER